MDSASGLQSSFFPPLDKVLSGSQPLLSFNIAYRALCDPARAAENTSLETFLHDDETKRLITRPPQSIFEPPSGKSRTDFETRTAPINISHSGNGSYDLEQIKQDALWLSKELDVEELLGLRIAVLEWQNRASDELLMLCDTPTEQNEFEILFLSRSTDGSTSSTNIYEKLLADSQKDSARHVRQLEIWLQERTSIFKIRLLLLELFAVSGIEEGDLTRGKQPRRQAWIEQLANDTENEYKSTNQQGNETMQCIEHLTSLLHNVNDPASRPAQFQPREGEPNSIARHKAFLVATSTDMFSMLRMILVYAHLEEETFQANVVLAWYQLMEQYHFLALWEPDVAIVADFLPLFRCLIAAVSVALLKITQTVEHLQQEAGAQAGISITYPKLPGKISAYIDDTMCVKELTRVLCRAGDANIVDSAPAVYAWAVLASLIRDGARYHQQLKESSVEDYTTTAIGKDHHVQLRRSSVQRPPAEPKSNLEKLFEASLDLDLDVNAREDPAKWISSRAVDHLDVYVVVRDMSRLVGRAYAVEADKISRFIIRDVFLTLLKEGTGLMPYSEPVVDAVLSVFPEPGSPGEFDALDSMLARKLLSDELLRAEVLDQAFWRYPHELVPLLELLGAIVSAAPNEAYDVLNAVENQKSFTIEVPQTFKGFRLTHEEEGANEIVLLDSIRLFVPKTAIKSYQASQATSGVAMLGVTTADERNVTTVLPGTEGIIIREDAPMVFKLVHPHSGFDYLVTLLSTYMDTAELVMAPSGTRCDASSAARIITFVSTLFRASKFDQSQTHRLLEAVNAPTGGNLDGDFAALVARIFETELTSYVEHAQPTSTDSSVEVLAACANFFSSSLNVMPERTWAILSHSILLGGYPSGAGGLVAVVEAVELPARKFSFLSSCVQLYLRLTNDAISGLVRRQSPGEGKRGNRFDGSVESPGLTPARTISAVLVAFGTVMLDAFQSLQQWNFEQPEQKSQMSVDMLTAFDKLIWAVYGGGTSHRRQIAAPLESAASNVLNAFADADRSSQLWLGLSSSLRINVTGIKSMLLLAWQQQPLIEVTAATNLITRVQNALQQDKKRALSWASKTIDLVPALAKIYAAENALRLPVAIILQQALECLESKEPAEQASIITRLPTSAAKRFLAILTQNCAIDDLQTDCARWRLLSEIMDKRLPWIAIFLLTGKLPKERLKESTKTKLPSSLPLLAVALQQLSRLSLLEPEKALVMLKFVARAQKAWVWAMTELRTHTVFLKNVLEWLNHLEPIRPSANPAQALLSARELRLAAEICDVLAVNLHAGLETGDLSLLDILIPRMDFLTDHAVDAASYNRSLHKNLSENFSNKYPQCDVGMFRRTAANQSTYGKTFAFDLEFAAALLPHNQSRLTHNRNATAGFIEEMGRASVNLSVVDAQASLLLGWERLAITLSECILQKPELGPRLALAAERCMRVNAGANLDEPNAGERLQTRMNLAFVLVSRLAKGKTADPTMTNLLAAAWSVSRASPVNYDVAVAPQDLAYQRTLLSTLYMCLQPHTYMDLALGSPQAIDTLETRHLSPETAAILVEIAGKVVATGFRALCRNLHDSLDQALPSDFALLTAILQSILKVRGITQVHPQLAEIFAASGLTAVALNLYTWSDRLSTLMDHDPTYGEIAVMFLLAMSTIAAVAEQMAVSGILTQLGSANLSNYLRKSGGKGPFHEPSRMFVIWSEGFLPLCLNLLDGVGPRVAGDVVLFLNSFPQQLDRASTALQNRTPTAKIPRAGTVTLGLLIEAHALATISAVLASDTARAAAEGIDAADVPLLAWNKAGVKDDIDALVRNKRNLRDRISPVGEREEVWKAMVGQGESADSILVVKILRELNEISESGVFGGSCNARSLS